MVPRPRLLLSLVLACKAEDLGVAIPRGGPEAVSQEDLQRDVWMLTEPALGGRAPGSPGAAEARLRIERRFQEMRLLPAFDDDYIQAGGAVCGRKEGRGDRALLVYAEDTGVGATDAASVAAVISLAKAIDVATPPERTWFLCAFPPGGLQAWLAKPAFSLDRTQVVQVGPLGGETLAALPGPEAGAVAVSTWSSEASAGWRTEADTADLLDYRRIEAQVRSLAGSLSAL